VVLGSCNYINIPCGLFWGWFGGGGGGVQLFLFIHCYTLLTLFIFFGGVSFLLIHVIWV
jgi:hypothetical protein